MLRDKCHHFQQEFNSVKLIRPSTAEPCVLLRLHLNQTRDARPKKKKKKNLYTDTSAHITDIMNVSNWGVTKLPKRA